MTAQANQANLLPDGQTAYNNLFLGVHQRVYFNKLASAGFAPRTPQEAEWMLETAGKLRTVKQAAPVKQAQDAQSPYFQANQALDQVMQQYGLATPTKQAAAQEEEMAIQAAAMQLSQDPTFYNSVLTLKTAEAAELQREWEAQQGQAQ